jgi:gamma-glutamylcysteine synthetase
MKESQSQTLWNEETKRRCGVIDNVFGHKQEKIKESQSQTLWNEETKRRCGVIDIAEKTREARLRWCGHVIRRNEGEPFRDIME